MGRNTKSSDGGVHPRSASAQCNRILTAGEAALGPRPPGPPLALAFGCWNDFEWSGLNIEK